MAGLPDRVRPVQRGPRRLRRRQEQGPPPQPHRLYINTLSKGHTEIIHCRLGLSLKGLSEE